MKLTNKIYNIYIAVLCIIWFQFISSCQKKDDFLNAKPSTSLLTVNTLSGLQSLLDNNESGAESSPIFEAPGLDISCGDEYYLTYSAWQSLGDIVEQNSYIWASDIYEGQTGIPSWNYPYQQVFYANVVLDELPQIAITPSNQQQWNNLKGDALFIRANAFYNLVQVFSPAYDSATASTDLGVPLRLHSNIDQIDQRSSVKDTYKQVISDLNQAISLVSPTLVTGDPGRPSKPAVYALLARTFLSMRDYVSAGKYADSTLQIYKVLMNYNQIPISLVPFTATNSETMYQSGASQMLNIASYTISKTGFSVDTTLYRLYDPNDLRITRFYRTPTSPIQINRNGGYTAAAAFFKGLATDEVYLIRAESYARSGNVEGAMDDLDTLLVNRYQSGTFVPLSAASPADALAQVLLERRKELVFRGTRWTDLRRLNKEGYNISLTRVLNGQTYTLPPNSPLFVLPIPPDEIVGSGIQQNPR